VPGLQSLRKEGLKDRVPLEKRVWVGTVVIPSSPAAAGAGCVRVTPVCLRSFVARSAVLSTAGLRNGEVDTSLPLEPLRHAVVRGGVPGARGAGRAVAHRVDDDGAGGVQRPLQGLAHQARQAPRPAAQRRRRARQLGIARGGSRARPRAERRGAAGARARRGRWGAFRTNDPWMCCARGCGSNKTSGSSPRSCPHSTKSDGWSGTGRSRSRAVPYLAGRSVPLTMDEVLNHRGPGTPPWAP
jgi:hypothetical protein